MDQTTENDAAVTPKEKAPKVDSGVKSEIIIHRSDLQRFLNDLRVIENSAPELFSIVTPLNVAKSKDLFIDRVRAKPPKNLNPHEELNVKLFDDLEKASVRCLAVVAENTKKKKRGKNVQAKGPKELPIMSHRELILETIANNQVVVIRGETGCGKTTQVPQFILDSFIKEKRGTDCRIVCTQPRRVAAISIAERVAQERKEELGGGGSVGFLIRCEQEQPRPEGGSILYCTVGVLLRKFQQDPALRDLTHIIVDEVHERAADSDILLAVLKLLLPVRPSLRVIIMSATIEVDLFSQYFGNCPILEVSGTNHTVQEIYMAEIQRIYNMPVSAHDLKNRIVMQNFITSLIVNVHEKNPPGAILVFCSGYDEIESIYKKLKATKDDSMKVYILHSLVPVRKDKLFAKPAEGTRKIILSTNVAESSITIEDVVYVIDNGHVKVMSYNVEHSMYNLQNSWITKANAKQRKGRAGRCQDGIVFRLYDQNDYAIKMQEHARANIAIERLDSMILSLVTMNFGSLHEFFASLLSPPPVKNIDGSLKALRKLGAISEDLSQLTSLGRRLADLHLEPQLGVMMIYGAIFNCLDPITSVVAFLSFKDVFMLPLGSKKGRRAIKANAQTGNPVEDEEYLSALMERQLDLDGDLCSDHLTRIKAVQEYMREADGNPNYCYENHLNEATMKQVMAMRRQILNSMARNKFIAKAKEGDLTNDHRARTEYLHMIRSVICAGLYPNTAGLAPVTEKSRSGKEVTKDYPHTPQGRKLNFHQRSVNVNRTRFDTGYFVYFKLVSTNLHYLHDSTMVHSLSLCLFASDIQFVHGFGVIVDNFYHFECSADVQTLIHKLRVAMRNIFNKTVNNPHYEQYKKAENEALQLIADVLALEEYTK